MEAASNSAASSRAGCESVDTADPERTDGHGASIEPDVSCGTDFVEFCRIFQSVSNRAYSTAIYVILDDLNLLKNRYKLFSNRGRKRTSLRTDLRNESDLYLLTLRFKDSAAWIYVSGKQKLFFNSKLRIARNVVCNNEIIRKCADGSVTDNGRAEGIV